MNFLKSYIIKRKSLNYYKSYYYKNSFYNFNFFERFATINSFDPSFFYHQSIVFKGEIDFNSSIKQVIECLGKPRYTVQDDNFLNYKILHYKSSINSLKNRSQLHFYNHIFFYGIQIFPYISAKQTEELFSLLKIKYALPANAELPLKIVDNQDNILFVSNNIYLTLEYISGNEQLINNLQAEYSQNLQNKEKREYGKVQQLMESL